ncbi:hypothetical protein ABMY26_06985 (plasmid) [Azospirillum sp. HJ39]|uniref:hypothetical protein n=1 Tax=Azospirillum sp. HJ39 TaxID=3159496 RepID=UPI003557AF42
MAINLSSLKRKNEIKPPRVILYASGGIGKTHWATGCQFDANGSVIQERSAPTDRWCCASKTVWESWMFRTSSFTRRASPSTT